MSHPREQVDLSRALPAHALAAWEQGLAQSEIERALTLTALALPDHSRQELAHLPLGQRDAALLGLRETMFGTDLSGVVTCPLCSERLEMTLDTRNLPRAVAPSVASFTLTMGEVVVSYRPPDSADLIAVQGCADVAAGRACLLDRCAHASDMAGAPQPVNELAEDLQSQIAEHMALADPHADLQLALECPACGHSWQVTLDIAVYLWHELHQWAGRMLWDIHRLAARYGWSEPEILNLSPLRRQMYLDFIGNG